MDIPLAFIAALAFPFHFPEVGYYVFAEGCAKADMDAAKRSRRLEVELEVEAEDRLGIDRLVYH